jgi:hypothetical protein
MHGIILDDVEHTVVDRDIHLYVQQSLDGSNWTTRKDWKAQKNDVEEITSRANGLFIFAATAVRYVIAGSSKVSPQKAVDYLLKGASLIHLHDIYKHIIDEAIAVPLAGDDLALDSYDCSKRAISTIFNLFEPLDARSLATVLDMELEDLMAILQPLSAVIHIPDADHGAIKIIHLSFRDFMTSKIKETRPDLLCGTEQQQSALASDILRIMYKALQFNICQLPTSYLRNQEMSDLPAWLDRFVPDYLRYSCRFWVDHIVAMPYRAECAQEVGNLLYNKFLFWLEVMSLLGIVGYASQALSKLIPWIEVAHFSHLIICKLTNTRIQILSSLPWMQSDSLGSLVTQLFKAVLTSISLHWPWHQHSQRLSRDLSPNSHTCCVLKRDK